MGDRAQGLWKTAMRFTHIPLVRNDMQKEEAWVWVQGRFSGSIPPVSWHCADRQQVIACHCYENKVGTFRKRAQEIDPEPGRVFSARLRPQKILCNRQHMTV